MRCLRVEGKEERRERGVDHAWEGVEIEGEAGVRKKFIIFGICEEGRERNVRSRELD